jgi:iron(III) transport system substrate-binding protein
MKATHLRISTLAAAGLFTASLLAAGAVFAQPAPTWDRILEAAKKEGKIVLYTNTVPPVSQRIVADFAKAYPDIKIEFNRLVGAQMNTTLTQERQTNVDGGDVVLSNETLWLEDRAKENALLPVTALPAFKGWPAKHIIGTTIPTLSLEPFAMLYNKQLVKTPITGYQDLLRPEFKGKIGTTVPRGLATVAWWDWVEKTLGADYMQKLAAQQPKLYQGVVPNSQAVASGEISVSMYVIASVAKPLQAQGAPIELVIPKPSLGFNFVGAAMGWSKRPNAALVFMDYIMSPRGQATWNGGRGEAASPLPKIEGAMDASTINLYDSRAYPANVVDAHTERLNKLFTGK